jgi:hypothetical protein
VLFVDIIGWAGTVLMLLGSIINIYKHTLCWPVWIAAAFCLIVQGIILGTWNIVVMQSVYIPINLYGWKQWRIDNENSRS